MGEEGRDKNVWAVLGEGEGAKGKQVALLTISGWLIKQTAIETQRAKKILI